jgi:pyruvate dehydrogenase E2 component (dihydrolipoamide acetyltransferase)
VKKENAMIQEIKMPSAGQTTDVAKIVAVNAKVGDSVKRGDILVEAETDKAVLPVESYTAGVVLDVLVKVGDDVDAGSVLVAVGQKGETYTRSGAPAPAASAVPVPAPVPAAPVSTGAKVGQEIKMPSAGQTTDDAKIVSVNVKKGDSVKRGDVLVEAETDKAVLPVESFTAGVVLDVLVSAGDTVTAGSTLVVVGKSEDAARYDRGGAEAPAVPTAAAAAPVEEDEYLPIIKGSTVAHTPAPAVNSAHSAYPAMPNAKWMARDKGADLASIVPANGQFIKRSDVLAALQAQSNTPAPAPAAAAEPDYEVLPMTRIRAAIGRRMQESMQNIPAWQCTVSIDMTACMALRDTCIAQKGLKLSYNDIMAKAIAVASRKYKLVNARYENGEVRVYRHTNVGLAVALDGALVVPVVKSIDEKGLESISQDYKALVKKARDGKLLPADMGCGSITISNLGMYDVDQFIAIVNPPESCILAVGSIRVEPVWDGNAFQPVHKMTVTGSFDHRIIDGAYGAQFLQELKKLMENPTLMLY